MPLVTTKIQWETDVMMSRINKTENMAGTVWKILDPLFAILTKKKKNWEIRIVEGKEVYLQI